MKRKVISTLFTFLLVMSSIGMVYALSLTINDPDEAMIYDSKKIDVDLDSTEVSDFYYFRTPSSRSAVRLCHDVMTCMKTVRFREGDNNIRIKVINDAGETDTKEVGFKVDSISPRIFRTNPRGGKLINNDVEFVVKYTETNLKEVTLFYETEHSSKTTCSSGRNQECSFDVDISTYDDQELIYWFELEDIAGNTRKSPAKVVKVDTTDPFVKDMSYTINRRRVSFLFEIEEKNFGKILLKDNRDRNPRWRRICSKLTLGACAVSKSFRSGIHDVDVQVFDKAGNSADIYTNEMIVI